MSLTRVVLAVLLAALISIGTAILGQRWLDSGGGDSGALGQRSTRLEIRPDLRLRDPSGTEFALDAWPERLLVVTYWASWCPACARELPRLAALQTEFGGAGVQAIGIAVDHAADAASFVAEHPVNFPILIATPAAVELARRLGNRAQLLPFTVIFDRRGRRFLSQTGALDETELRHWIERLLEQRSGPFAPVGGI